MITEATIAEQVWKEPVRNLVDGVPAAASTLEEQYAAAIWAAVVRTLSDDQVPSVFEGTSLVQGIPAALPDSNLAGLPAKIPVKLPNYQAQQAGTNGIRLNVNTGGEAIGVAWIMRWNTVKAQHASRWGANYVEWDPKVGGLLVESPNPDSTWIGAIPDDKYLLLVSNAAVTRLYTATVVINGGVFYPGTVTFYTFP